MSNRQEPTHRTALKQFPWLVWSCLFLFPYCHGVEGPTIESLQEDNWLVLGRRITLTGRRDGDLLPVRVTFASPPSLNLSMDLRLRIGVPTRLESGQYRFEQDDKILEGPVRARSVTFLGGQSDHPNLGGVFELLSAGGSPIYIVTLPTSEVSPPLPESPALVPSH